jgi:endoglucanase
MTLRTSLLASLLLTLSACGGADETTPTPPAPETLGASIGDETGGRKPDDVAPTEPSGGAGSASRPPTMAPGATSWVPLPFRGINLAGGDGGSLTTLPGTSGTNYQFPGSADVDYFLGLGMNTFRVVFKWERMQPTLNGDLAASYLANMDALVTDATAKGAYVILEPHNFARYQGKLVGSPEVPNAAFADLWSRLATKYAANDKIFLNLVNEPHDMPTEQWVSAANDAIAAIRKAGAKNLIMVPGNAWTAASSWSSSKYGTANAVAMLDVKDPIDNIVYEVHQYLDGDESGGSSTCVSTNIGRARLKPFVDWLRLHKKRGFLGETAAGDNPTCHAAMEDMLRYIGESSDVLLGWLWWADGPWFRSYQFSLFPKNNVEQPWVKRLSPHLSALTARTTVTSKTTSSYCADVEVFDWRGTKSLDWTSAAVDLKTGTSTSVAGGTLSAQTGLATMTPDAIAAKVPLHGGSKVSICGTGDSVEVLSASAK